MKSFRAVFILLFIAMSIVLTGNGNADSGIIPVTKFISPAMNKGVPEGWSLEKKTGQPAMKLEKDGNIFYLHLTSMGNSSFGVRKESRVDIKKFPILCWRWKVAKLPRGGDVRRSATDDQALQVYVAFKESGLMGLNTPVIGYIWDNEAPKGWSGRSPQIGGDKLRYIVLRNKTDKVGKWYTERRNVYQDYKRLFADLKGGEPQGPTTGLQIYINSQRTKSQAESIIGDIYFSSEPSDIALAEAGKDIAQVKVAVISAVRPRPQVIVKLPVVKKLTIPDCVNVNIEFSPDSISIGNNYNETLQIIVDYLIRNPDAKLNIAGHSDNVGLELYNLFISNRRAANVKAYLEDKFGIDPLRLNVQGAGSVQPIAGNDTPEGRQQNRRVTISNCPEE
jgi:outer membrane protein OmpA-like peptidoglycan-associated protein